jgi:colanic acid/amylovoran biosynthesis glycosyltransferase
MADVPPTLAYLTSQYGRPTDTFIRDEVAALRALGHTVHTLSIRRPAVPAGSEAVERERAATDYVLDHRTRELAGAAARRGASQPARFAAAARLAARASAPGARGRALAAAYLVEASYLAGRLEALEVDHLHDHMPEGSATVAMLASALTGVPWSMTIHGPELERAPVLALDLKAERAEFVVTIADAVRAELLGWVSAERGPKVHVVRCGLAGAVLDAPPPQRTVKGRFVSVGRLDPEKGQLVLVDAAARVPGAEVLLVGDGAQRPAIEQRIAALGIGDRVRVAGWLDAAAVLDSVAESLALVMPGLREGIPMVVMEAFALGRPVVATAVGGIPELVRPGENGWLVAAGSADELATAMSAALATPREELDRRGRAGRERVVEQHDVRRSAARLSELFAGGGARR